MRNMYMHIYQISQSTISTISTHQHTTQMTQLHTHTNIHTHTNRHTHAHRVHPLRIAQGFDRACDVATKHLGRIFFALIAIDLISHINYIHINNTYFGLCMYVCVYVCMYV